MTQIAPASPRTSRFIAPRPDPASLHEDSLLLALERVLSCEDAGPAFRARLERYAPFLATEFETSTTSGALREALQCDPGLAPRVSALEGQQRRILRDLERLIELLERSPCDSPRSWSARRRLVRRLRIYRRAEERLLFDAHFQDTGGEGA